MKTTTAGGPAAAGIPNRIRRWGGWLLVTLWLLSTGAVAGMPATRRSAAVDSDSGSQSVQPPERRPPVSWPIDVMVDSVLRVINTTVLARIPLTKGQWQQRQAQFRAVFAPTGYFIVLLPNNTELWVSTTEFLTRLSRAKGVQYQLKAAKVIHFSDVSRTPKGQYSGQATVYFDVNRFENHLPVTKAVSQVTVPLGQLPPAPDYWQIYELKIVEVSNSVLAAPR